MAPTSDGQLHCNLSSPHRTFVFNKLLPQPSELLMVTLPRPMGVVFEYDQQKKRAVVADVMEGSAAEQKQKVAGLNPNLAKESVQTGELLSVAECKQRQMVAVIGAAGGQRQCSQRRQAMHVACVLGYLHQKQGSKAAKHGLPTT